MVAAREGALAARTLERPVAGVLAVVAGQLVGAGELPRAALPRAAVRLLAGVRAQVRLEVRTLVVRLCAAVERTLVDRQSGGADHRRPSTTSPPAARQRRRRRDLFRLEHFLVDGEDLERRAGRRDGRVVAYGRARVGHRQRATVDPADVIAVEVRRPVFHLLRRRRRRRQSSDGLVRKLSPEVAGGIGEEPRFTDRHLWLTG